MKEDKLLQTHVTYAKYEGFRKMYRMFGTRHSTNASVPRYSPEERVLLIGGVGGANTQSTYNPFGYPNPPVPLRDQSFPYRPLAGYVQGGILVCGGQDVGSGAVANTKRCQHYTLMDADWVEYPEMLREHERGRGIEIDGAFWVTGGLDQGEADRLGRKFYIDTMDANANRAGPWVLLREFETA